MGVRELTDGALVSIIVPSYNVKEYIERTISSICNQRYKNIEIIIVDDGSTDGTRELIEQIQKKDNRIKSFFKEHEGVTKARLYGVKKAQGDWIGFIDSDDLISEDMYEILLRNALEYKADISHCGYKMIFPDREIFHYGTKEIVEQNSQKGLIDLIEGSFIEPTLCNKLFKRELFKNLFDQMDYSITNFEDLLMNFYLFKQSKKSVFFDVCNYYYMVRKNSAATSQITIQKISGPEKVFKIIKEKCLNDQKLTEILDKRITCHLLQVLLIKKRNSPTEVREYCKKAKKELKSLRTQIKKNNYSRKIKMLSFLAVNFPIFYRMIHSLYAKITGNNKKYKI